MKYKLIRITTVPISLKILLKGQLSFMNKFFDVVAVSSKGKELDEVKNQEGVKIKAIDMTRQITPLQDLISLIKMIIFLKKEKPHIVHTHTPKAGLIGMLASWIVGVPNRVHTVAGMPLMESKGIKRKVLTAVEKLTYKCATKVYPNSFGLYQFILENRLTNKSKLKVIANGSTNGVDTQYFQKSLKVIEEGEKIKKYYQIKDNDFIFIFVGRVVKDKGINELLSAFDKLSKEKNNVKLLIIGPFEENLDPISQKSKNILKQNSSIINFGFQEDIRPFLAISNCLVFPSYREGFPNVVMQAGAMELPAIVSNINGCNEIIKHNVNGFIIPAKDEILLYKQMLEILKNSLKLKKMSKVARDMIVNRYEQRYLWTEIKKEYDNLIRNIK